MFRLRPSASLVFAVLWSGPLFLVGCADAGAPRLPALAVHEAALVTTGSTGNADAELIMARAIAEHEMRRP